MTKRMVFMILGLVLVFGGVFGWQLYRGHLMAQYFVHHVPPPVTVSAKRASAQTWHPALVSVGSLAAVNGVDISSEVGAIVERIHFKSGEKVRGGDLLVELDDKAELADLKNYQARLKLAQLNHARKRSLYEKSDISAEDFDEARATLQEAAAMVAKTEAIIGHKNIKAPFDGKLGIRQFDLGDYVSPGRPLVNLQSLDPVHANFSLPEQDFKRIFVGQKISITVEAYENETFQGKITAIDSKVNEKTRNILVQATLPNQNNYLYPGMFANIKVILPEQRDIVTVPQTAIAYNLYGDSVFVIRQDGKDEKGEAVLRVERRYVSVGDRHTDQVAILEGVKAGELIVTSGQLKLQNGSRVAINNSVDLSIPKTMLRE